VNEGILIECHRIMAFMAERMKAFGETSKEATQKVISGEKDITFK
jgi:hypothetical protein